MSGKYAANSNQDGSNVKAFQFIEGRPSLLVSEGTEDKENRANRSPNGGISDKIRTDAAIDKSCPPSTPATRLPLADLIGNAEDSSKRRKLTEITPEEHVSWHHSVSPGASQPLVTPARKRKRARSSSPPSSQRETSNLFPANAEAQAVPPQLRTPQADPAADLWNRYTSNPTGNDTSGGKEALFAHLIKDTSPRSSSDAGSISGLRRWASCGIEWPTSAGRKKRRKLAKIVEEQDHAEQSETMAEGGPKRSKVDELLQRMKETLAREREDIPRGPSSSSPLPACGTTDATSPLQRLTTTVNQHQQTPTRSEAVPRPTNPPPAEEKLPVTSSDYGEVEIDTDMLEAIDNTAPQTQLSPVVERPCNRSPEADKVVEAPCHLDPTKNQLISDEFGGDDDEDFAADFELMASRYDSQAQQKSSGSRTVGPEPGDIGQKVEISSEDEFGDDTVDLEEFAAAEAAATQAYMAPGQSNGSVRPFPNSL